MALAEGAAKSSAAERLAAFITVRTLGASATPGDKLWLTTADGSTTVSVPKQAYELSGHLTKQLNAQGLGESLMKPIILPQQVGRETLSRLVTYFEFHCGTRGKHSDEDTKAFDSMFVRAGLKKLLELTSAAQSLQIPGLMQTCLQALDDPSSTSGASCSSSPTSASAAAARAAAKAPAAVGVISAAEAPLTHVISKATRSAVPASALAFPAPGSAPASWPPVSQAQRTAIYHAAMSAAASCGTIDYIWLATSDGSTVLSVHKKAAELSPFILRHLFSTSCGFTEADPILVPQQVGAATLKRLALYFNFHGAPGLADKERKDFDGRFVKLDTKRLCELMSAADSLEMRQLVELSSRALVKVIQGKTPEEIRDALNMPDDLTEEEKLVPVPGDPDDPRIRLLNRLYAKKRKELQSKKQEEPRLQQDRGQVEDTRSLDELLSFIGGEDEKQDPSKDKAAKKKKKKGVPDRGQAQRDTELSQGRQEHDQQSQETQQQLQDEEQEDAASREASLDRGAKRGSTSKSVASTSDAGGGEVSAAGPGRPKADAPATGNGVAAAQRSASGPACSAQTTGSSAAGGNVSGVRGRSSSARFASQPSTTGAAEVSAAAATAPALAVSRTRKTSQGEKHTAGSSSSSRAAAQTSALAPTAPSTSSSVPQKVEAGGGSAGKGAATAGIDSSMRADGKPAPAVSAAAAPLAAAAGQHIAVHRRQQQQQHQPLGASTPSSPATRHASMLAGQDAPAGVQQPLPELVQHTPAADCSAASTADPCTSSSGHAQARRRHDTSLSVAVDLGNPFSSQQSPHLQPAVAASPNQQQQQQVLGWGQQEPWATWAQQSALPHQHAPAQWNAWGNGSSQPSPAQQQPPWPGLLPGDLWLQPGWAGQGSEVPVRPRARLSALPALEGEPDEAGC